MGWQAGQDDRGEDSRPDLFGPPPIMHESPWSSSFAKR